MQVEQYPAVADAQGKAIVTIQPFGHSKWQVQQVTTKMPNAPAGATCIINRNGYPVAAISAQVGTASGLPYIEIGTWDRMTVEWEHLTPGLTGQVQIFYEPLAEGYLNAV